MLAKLEQHLILSGMSDYNRYQTLKVTKMLAKKYSIRSPTLEFGQTVYTDMVKAGKSNNYIRNTMKVIEGWAASQGRKLELPRPKHTGHRREYLSCSECGGEIVPVSAFLRTYCDGECDKV